MKYADIIIAVCIVALGLSIYAFNQKPAVLSETRPHIAYWFLLYRASNKELLYYGEPGNREQSRVVRTFQVKTGMPGVRPTPLPQLVDRQYWILTGKAETADHPETAPYFLALDVPYTDGPPYGPAPYMECDGQCNWELAGAFGLHGIGGDETRLAAVDPGSSGCIRHRDEDITYLYQLLDPEAGEIRYYVEDETYGLYSASSF